MVDLYTGTVPNLTQSQPEFDENTQGILDYIAGLAPQLNEWVGVYVQDTTSASTTSNTIGTGSKTFTVEAGKGYKVNMTLRASATSGNFMDGVVTAYSGTSLTINFSTFTGSGTFGAWNIFLTISGGATLASNTFTGNQFVPDDAYDASGWNGNLSVPTKNAMRDKIESVISGLFTLETASGDPTYASTSDSEAATPAWVKGLAASGSFDNIQVFTSNGSFTIPPGVLKLKVTVAGGGGGAGGTSSGSTGGGGGGGYVMKIIDTSSLSSPVSVTVGQGGAGGGSGLNGNPGGTSSFGSACSATGGGGSIANGGTSPTAGGNGGTGSGGDLNASGQSGAPSSGSSGGYGIGGYNPTGYGRGANGRASAGSGSSGSDGVVIIEW